jgi:DNA polymerase V
MDLPPSRRVILHTDVNSAYANMERVFNPKLRDKPVCILSNNDGCIVALTKDAKALGIKRGTPYFKVRDLCEKHGVAVLSSNYELYDAMSSRFHKIVAGFGPVHEAYSIDEAFLDLTGVETESFTELGRALKARLWKWIGLPVCVGIAPTKTLAKLCDHFAKTYPVYGGVVNWFDLSPERRKKALSITPIGEVWGIGRKTEEKLLREGIENVWQFSQADVFTLRRRYGVVLERTLREIQGVSCLPVESVPKPKEQILRSRSFSHATNDRSVLLSSVSTHMTEVARQLRREKAEAKKAGVFFLTSPFKENEPWHAAEPVTELTLPTSDTMRLVEVACRLVEAHWRPGFRYCKAGAFVTDLIPEGSSSVTGSLFDLPDEERDATRRRLMECLDDLTRRFGKGAWKIGSSGLADGWQMKRDRLTPAYLTRWADIMTVS